MDLRDLKPGRRIRVHQEIDRREGNWRGEVVGTVVEVFPQATGSWFVHGKNTRLWLNRIRLRKDDGEITIVVVDPHTRVEALPETPAPGSSA